MAVSIRRQFSKGKGYATLTKATVVPLGLPSEFSPDPLTKVIQNGAQA
jgi:hypothetical protein